MPPVLARHLCVLCCSAWVVAGLRPSSSRASSRDSANRGSAAKSDVNIAVCIVGGLRDFTKSSESLRKFLYNYAQHAEGTRISTHVVAWSDYDAKCYPSLNKSIHDAYSNMNLTTVSLLNHSEADVAADVVLSRLSPALYNGSLMWKSQLMSKGTIGWFKSPYMQAVLLEKCMSVTQDADVVVRVRPDFDFKASASWKGRNATTGEPIAVFINSNIKKGRPPPFIIQNNSIFVWRFFRHRMVPDDAFAMGSGPAMRRAFGRFRLKLDTGYFQMEDGKLKSLSTLMRTPDHDPFPLEAPWRASNPEVLFEQAILSEEFHMMNLPSRDFFGDVHNGILANRYPCAGPQ